MAALAALAGIVGLAARAAEPVQESLPMSAESPQADVGASNQPTPPVADTTVEPWQIAPSDLGTQRLFRVRYDGPEGEGSVRLTLKLLSPRRYRVSTLDLLGRPVWSLAVEGDDVTWIDDRQRRVCRFHGELTPSSVPLAPFSLPALPALLLGRLPEAPAGPTSRVPGGRVEYDDAAGHRWSVDLHAGTVLGWTRWTDGEPSAWWRWIEGEGILSERDRGMQIRWRQVLSEPIAELPPPTPAPPGYEDACAGLSDVASEMVQNPPH